MSEKAKDSKTELTVRSKRFLRGVEVGIVVTAAGLVLSIAAFLVVIGIGRSQIIATEEAGKHHAHVFASPWFLTGLGLAIVGLLIGFVALIASTSQAIARREFPDLLIRVVAKSAADVDEPGEAPFGGHRVHLVYLRLHIASRERTRTAILSPTLLWELLESERSSQRWSPSGWGLSPARWVPKSFPGLPSINALPLPLHVSPNTAVEGDLFFETALNQVQKLDPRKPPTIFLNDQGAEEGFEVLMAAGNQGPHVI